MVSLNFAFRYLTCLGPVLLCIVISVWSAFLETAVYSDFVRKDKKRKEGQVSPNYPLTHSATTQLASLLFLDNGRQPPTPHPTPAHSLVTGQGCLECSSPRYLHGSPLTFLKTFSKATFSMSLTGTTLFNTITSHHAHSHTPDTIPHLFTFSVSQLALITFYYSA